MSQTATKPARTSRTSRAAEPTAPPAAPKSHTTFRHRGVTVRPSSLPPALTGFVCDAVVLAAGHDMRWNFTARFVAHVRLSVGTVMAYDPGLVRKLFAEAGGADAFRCFGPYDGHGTIDHRDVGEAVLRAFAGMDPEDDGGVDTDDLVEALFEMLAAPK